MVSVQVKNTLKKVGAVAGSVLMVGMTMGAAQSLADFPQPFVTEDGTVASQIVVGSSGKVADVVGAVNIAAALGQHVQPTVERQVSTGGGFGWSASDGTMLDTRNDNLYFGNPIDTVRQTLTADHLDALTSTTFTDEDSQETEVEYFLYPGSQNVTFGSGGQDQDPFLLVDNPENPSPGNHLIQLQANFGEELNFTMDVNQDQELALFGNEYTVSQDSTFDELILFGSTQTVSLQSGQSGTITVNGNEHTVEVVAVNDGGVAYSVDGDGLVQRTEGETFSVEGETVRIDDVVNLQDDSGSASFEVGSEELSLTHDDAIQDSDGNDIDGTHVEFDADGQSNGPVDDLSTINIYIGEQDDDNAYVRAGESFSHPLFRNVRFAFGGLNPDAGAGTSDAVEQVTVDGQGSDTIQASFTTDRGDAAALGFSHTPDQGQTVFLADGDNRSYRMVEAQTLQEDEHTIINAGNEDDTEDKGVLSRLVRVTDIGDDEATLRDVAAASTFAVDFDSTDGEGTVTDAVGSEVIDGRTYHFLGTRLNTTSPEIAIAWGDGAGTTENSGGNNDDTITAGTQTSAYMTLTTREGGEVTFLDDAVPAGVGISDGDTLVAFNADEMFVDATQSTEGGNGYGDGDDIVRDLGGSGTYSTGQDTTVAGTTPSDGTTLTATNPFTATPALSFIDDGDSMWEAGSDIMVTDDDQDGVVTATADTLLNGTAAQGDALTATKPAAWANVTFFNETATAGWDAAADAIILENQTGGGFGGQYNSGDQVMAGNSSMIAGTNLFANRPSGWTTVLFNDTAGVGNYDVSTDAVVEDTGGSGTYSTGPDTQVAGISIGTGVATDGAALTTNNPWSGASPPVMFNDAGTTNLWETGSDVIVLDEDGDGAYTGQADTLIVDGSDVSVSEGDTLTAFAATTKHDESVTSNGQYDSGETIAVDANTNNQYDSGETVLLGATGGQDMHPAVSDYINANGKPSNPTMLFIEEEDADDDTPYWYAVGTSGNTADDRVDVTTPVFRGPAERVTATLESNSDVTAGYDVFGAYTEYNTNDQGQFDLFYPDGQAVAGAAFTAAGGALDAAASAQVTVDALAPHGSLPSMARLDTEVTESVRSNNHLILIGGPAVNTLVAQLQDRLALDDVPRSGGALLQVVEDAFTDGRHALVVAGLEAEDTRAAARYLQSYGDHADALADVDGAMVLSPDDYPD